MGIPLETHETLPVERPVAAAAAILAPTAAAPDAMRPVLVVVDDDSGELARRAAAAGLDAALVGANAFDVAVRLALKQLLELQQLRQKVDRQARVERAKGVLMERYRLPEPRAHELLQRHARNMNLKLTEVADAVVESHTLFADSSAIIPRRVPGDAA